MIKEFKCKCGYEKILITDYQIENKIPVCPECSKYMEAVEKHQEKIKTLSRSIYFQMVGRSKRKPPYFTKL
jgi:hypothetical protein